LRGIVEVDPAQEDFFRVIVEERLRLSSRRELSDTESKRLEKALKVLASATSYGIYAQMDRQEDDEKVNLTCHGVDSEPFECNVAHPDLPGEFCFPPLASLITGGARLMLALLEHCVSDLGGTYVMEDTDSMAIVATEHGGLVPCPGGPFEMKDGHTAVKAFVVATGRRHFGTFC
jgi:formylglycine-generating enzyme required for sulfatase activity